MEAHGLDGIVAVNHSHVTISWKTLRGRLASSNGAPNEVISLDRIYDVSLLSAGEKARGCFQIHLIGSSSTLAKDISWLTDIREGRIAHAVMFNLDSQFQFHGICALIKDRINSLRTPETYFRNFSDLADGA